VRVCVRVRVWCVCIRACVCVCVCEYVHIYVGHGLQRTSRRTSCHHGCVSGILVGVRGRGRKLVAIQTGARACQQRSLAAEQSAQPPKSECELAAQRLDAKIRSLPKFLAIALASRSTMTAAACVDRTERVQSGLPRVFVCALACISMQTPGGRCSFLRAGTMFQRILVGVPRTSALPSLSPSAVPPTRSPVDTAQIPSSAHTGHQGVAEMLQYVCLCQDGARERRIARAGTAKSAGKTGLRVARTQGGQDQDDKRSRDAGVDAPCGRFL
jgi:hypothetical protein